MASSYPSNLDSLTNPTASDTLDSATVPHAAQHANANDAIEAVQSTLGTNPQGGSATVVARLNTLDSTVTGKASTTHASTHGVSGSDPVTIASTQVSGLGTASTKDVASSGDASSTQVVKGDDSRLSDTRTPTNNTVTDAKIATAGLAQSSINGVAITTWAASTSYAKGALVEYKGIAYRRISAGTSRSSFDATEQTFWHQITPTPTSNGGADSLIVTDSTGSLNFYTMTGVNYNFASTGSGTTALTHGSGFGNNSLELPLTDGVLVSTGDIGTVSDTMLAGSIAPSKVTGLLKTLVQDPDLLVVGSITRNSSNVVTSAAVVWPDGATGTYTSLSFDSATGAVNSYQITKGSATYTQPTLTRNSAGAVTNRPAIVVT